MIGNKIQRTGKYLYFPEKINNFSDYYFTYGSDLRYPFQGGWTVVLAPDKKIAKMMFKAMHPNLLPGVLNCADYYSAAEMVKTGMLADGNRNKYCQESIGLRKSEESGKKYEIIIIHYYECDE